MEEIEVRGGCDEKKERGEEKRGVSTDRWIDNVLMTQDPPGDIAVSLCHSPLSSSLTFYHTSLFSLLLSFSFVLFYHRTVSSESLDTFLFYSLFRTRTPHPPPSLLPLLPSSPSFLLPLWFSLMDGANVHQQQRPSGGDPFLHLLTEGHNWPAEIIHSFTVSISVLIHVSAHHPSMLLFSNSL